MEASPTLEQLRTAALKNWSSGNFGKIAAFAVKGGEEFVERLEITPGLKVLDVACGTGNTAIPAARAGADVTGLDIVQEMLDQARERARAEELTISFDLGDAEDLPYPDASFDLVMSMFGAMFAPRPEVVAAQLARVCKPGGRLAMGNWTPAGFTGRMFRLGAEYSPPPAGITPPVLWGDVTTVTDRLTKAGFDVHTGKRTVSFHFPFPPAGVVQFFREHFGPTKVAFARVDEHTQRLYAAALEQMWHEENLAGEDETMIESEYLEVIGVRR
ncbi:class I SAM-dependent methyltransferase [Silvibacterium acidisoli]|uniref:class I SAM-dependent methyltransferase n=1 Tax=Acidobacteriaceae bacterium ZG23-2 TaxID=2883246 RepID=UPI00406D2573